MQPSFLSFVLRAGFAEVDGGWPAVEKAMEDATAEQSARLFRKIEYLSVIGNIAPMVGLLGTVIGMIGTFQMITLFGTGDPRMMAGGISTALVTTVLGLVVAIPLTWLHSFLQGKANSLIQLLEQQSAGLIARLAERRQ